MNQIKNNNIHLFSLRQRVLGFLVIVIILYTLSLLREYFLDSDLFNDVKIIYIINGSLLFILFLNKSNQKYKLYVEGALFGWFILQVVDALNHIIQIEVK